MSKSEGYETYTDVLAPAIVEGVSAYEASSPDVESDFMTKANAVAASTLAMLDEVDWDNSGLPDRKSLIDGEPVLMAPKAFAEHLTVEAFQDAITLMDFCVTSVIPKRSAGGKMMGRMFGKNTPADSETDQAEIPDALANSKQTILNKVLGLTDSSKHDLYAALKKPSMSKLYLGFKQYEPPIQLVQGEGQDPKFVWSDNVERWIKSNTLPGRGCPARSFLVNSEQGRQPVTHYLWDQLVGLRYNEQRRQAAVTTLGSAATIELMP